MAGSSPTPARLDTAGLAGDERLAAEAVNARGRPYDVLSVGGSRISAGSTMEDIRSAYKRLALVFHSDKGRCLLHGNEAFTALTEAWHAVRDEKRPREASVADPAPEPSVAPRQEPVIVRTSKRRRTERQHPHSDMEGTTARSASTHVSSDVNPVAPGSAHVHDDVNSVAPGSVHVHGDVNPVTPGEAASGAPDVRRVQRAPARALGKRTRGVPSDEEGGHHLLTPEEQRHVIRQMAGTSRWLEAVWRHAGPASRAEPLPYKWLGFLAGGGGRYARVQWLYRESQDGGADYVDNAGRRWEQLTDEDGDDAIFVTSVPDVDQRIEVLELKAHSGAPQLDATRAKDSVRAKQ